ncbi:MAG TPA: hypothetical protein H9792_01340 [Candidatus Limosilactobacillus excrementigallinarum]|nr:hypothetical protein [Candidatus Limosilactobacillus excrementigallinarum]
MSDHHEENLASDMGLADFKDDQPKAVFACVMGKADQLSVKHHGNPIDIVNAVMSVICSNPDLAAFFISGNESMLRRATMTLAQNKIDETKDKGEKQDD